MDASHIVVYAVVILGISFEFLNGFHYSANAIATVVATGSCGQVWPFSWPAFSTLRAPSPERRSRSRLARVIVDPKSVSETTVAVALLCAGVWDLITWYFSLPTSSSHSLSSA